jgi:hypothetical protein
LSLGKGVADWPELFAAARTGGVKNCCLAMDLDPMQASIP